ncbi:MAG TPA: sulfatase-like hydrolase/transferase, partial [Candidatus Baltobacteraceae bacterium]|nr:sulfatase-like hydrolase/transferase [Candidatus Baltobacteraceae bacterium]
MKRFTLLLLLALSLLTPAARAADAPARRPNIVFFIADDMSIKDSAAYGPTNIPGPNMEALARKGMIFDRAYATSPSCAPSRAALLTGCYNVRNGVMWNQQRANAAIKKWPAYFQAL